MCSSDLTNARGHCKELIGQVREALGATALGDIDTHIEGLRDIYRKGRRAFQRMHKKDSAARRHELRKQAKYLRVALEVIDVPDYEHARERAGRVASWLGEDHDLAVLRDRIGRSGSKSESGDERWFRRIKDRQEKLQRKAFAKAEKLFEEKPKQFVAKLRSGDGH